MGHILRPSVSNAGAVHVGYDAPMRTWLARLAMSFFVVAAVLIWEAYQGSKAGVQTWRIMVYLVAAAAGIALGVAGTREKHRRAP